jgi:hypothetical protein
MITQVAGLRFATPTEWRVVFFISATIGLIQFLVSYLVVETPTWLRIKDLSEEVDAVSRRLWGAHANPLSCQYILSNHLVLRLR